jgi:branched-chain amino acid transport system substrate-binding protein
MAPGRCRGSDATTSLIANDHKDRLRNSANRRTLPPTRISWEGTMKASIARRHLLASGLAAAALTRAASAQSKPIRIGVLTDMVGVYSANTGAGSVAGTKLAIEDFAKLHPEIKVELVSADLQLKPDVAVAIAGNWLDNQGVDLITDVPLSSAAFAIGDIVKAKDKAAIFTGGASADITGSHCGPNHLHWAYDTWSMPHAVVDATVKEGGDTWFFITADYAFGHALESDAASFVTAAGGTVLGHDRFLGVSGAGEGKWRQSHRLRQRRR